MLFGYASIQPETEATLKLMEGLKEGKLLATRCAKCGVIYLPPRVHCKKCYSQNVEWFEAPMKGKLLTYTQVEVPPEKHAKNAPYVVGVAELGVGLRLLARVVGFEGEELKVGMAVEVAPLQIADDRIAYILKPSR